MRLEGDELLLSFRQAPVTLSQIHHVHPRSLITVVRSRDGGRTWDFEAATQLAAGGGQELGLVYLGNGLVAGCLAAHESAASDEGTRMGTEPGLHPSLTPSPLGCAVEEDTKWMSLSYANQMASWVWSTNYGITWPLANHLSVHPSGGPFSRSHSCSAPIYTADGSICFATYGDGSGGVSDGFGQAPPTSVLWKSRDQGRTWAGPIIMAQGDCESRGYAEPAIVETQPGRLLAMYRIEQPVVGQPRRLFWNESDDFGETWSKPLPAPFLAGACPRLHMLRDDRVLLTYGRRLPPVGLYAALSSDCGKTWSERPLLIRKAPDSNHGYSSSVELSDGTIFTTNYASGSAATQRLRPNGAPYGVVERDNPTGIVGTYWQPPPRRNTIMIYMKHDCTRATRV